MSLDEHVLVIPARVLESVESFRGFSAAATAHLSRLLDPAHLEFRPRSEVETDPAYKQLVPYTVIRCDDAVFHYTRGAGGGEARLRALRSIGIGGHVSREDAIDATDWYRAGFERELNEEVEIACPYLERVIGLVYDLSTPVGEVHLGIVHELRLDQAAVRPREAGIASAGFAPLADLWAERAAFETWSQFVLEALVQHVPTLAPQPGPPSP